MSKAETTRWFKEEVQPHEPSLRSHLRNRFPSLSDVDDLVQETYLRLICAKSTRRISFVKAFLFTTARNLAIDIFRHRQAIPMESTADLEGEACMEDKLDIIEIIGKREELKNLAQAIHDLPQRCREILTLRLIYGHSYKIIAQELGISEYTVKAQIAKGMRRCAEYFREHGLMEERPSLSTATNLVEKDL